MKRSLTLAEDLEISEKCSVALTDANFKNIIESNGECADVGCYVQNMCSFYSIPPHVLPADDSLPFGRILPAPFMTTALSSLSWRVMPTRE